MAERVQETKPPEQPKPQPEQKQAEVPRQTRTGTGTTPETGRPGSQSDAQKQTAAALNAEHGSRPRQVADGSRGIADDRSHLRPDPSHQATLDAYTARKEERLANGPPAYEGMSTGPGARGQQAAAHQDAGRTAQQEYVRPNQRQAADDNGSASGQRVRPGVEDPGSAPKAAQESRAHDPTAPTAPPVPRGEQGDAHAAARRAAAAEHGRPTDVQDPPGDPVDPRGDPADPDPAGSADAQDGAAENDDPTFDNQLPEQLDDELEVAERHGVEPVGPTDPGFDDVVNEGTVKWGVTQDGDLVVVPAYRDGEEISHAVLDGGEPMVAAGTADIAGTAEDGHVGVAIDNHSGHYQPSDESLAIGVAAFAAHGIVFDDANQTRVRGAGGH